MSDTQLIFHTVAGLHPRSGGPSRSVTQLTDAIAARDEFNVTVISQRFVDDVVIESQESSVVRNVGATRFKLLLPLAYPFRTALNRALSSGSPSLIHDHGLWLATNHLACRLARDLGIPFIIQPRGMLEPWALDYRAWKKRIALMLYQRRHIETANLLVATSLGEASQFRNLGFCQPIAVIPNGIPAPVRKLYRSIEVGHGTRDRILLFFSRIHPVKGLLNLIEAWSIIKLSGWQLHIAGPNEDGHLSEVMSAVVKLRVENSVRYIGVVDDSNKALVYCAADLFVLPTFSENFGIVVAEALSFGLPVITTKGAPWGDLERFGCGWWIDIGVEPLVQALRQAMSLTDDERRAMGMRGRKYVKRYDWDTIAQQTIAVYRWMLGQGSKPDCVHLD